MAGLIEVTKDGGIEAWAGRIKDVSLQLGRPDAESLARRKPHGSRHVEDSVRPAIRQ